MNLSLVKYDRITKKEYLSYLADWESTTEKMVPSAVLEGQLGFAAMQKKWQSDENLADNDYGIVPATLYFLVQENQRILGAIHLRHRLTPQLEEYGGHIGYGIRPTERRKGYGTIMLKMLLQGVCKNRLEAVLITCDDSNLGSAGIIEACGGKLKDKPIIRGVQTRRYWVSSTIF